MKPFLKWAGNKYPIMDRIKSVLPSGRRLIEPFAGSAAVFLNTHYSASVLNDINPDLMKLYQYLKNEGLPFIDYCRTFFQEANNNPAVYYELRNLFNTTTNPRVRAALFLYFNKHGYNGLCRYNSQGGFNVPFGRYKKPYFPEKEMLYFYTKSITAEISNRDFETVMKSARPGDVVYCDPPYVPLSGTANFTSYSSHSFGLEQQEILADLARHLSGKGIPVVISNHDTEFTQQAYQSAQIIPFKVQRFISCHGDNRQQANEVLALFA